MLTKVKVVFVVMTDFTHLIQIYYNLLLTSRILFLYNMCLNSKTIRRINMTVLISILVFLIASRILDIVEQTILTKREVNKDEQ